MVFSIEDVGSQKCSFENAIDLSGFGRYNLHMLAACCFLILAMFNDMFGLSVVMPAIACDISLNTTQQGLLTAIPLVGVMLSSYVWGLATDTIGRRKTLLIAMPIGFVLNIIASMAPGLTSLALLKFFCALFTSAANAAAFVLVAESVPRKNRSRFMFIMASVTMSVLGVISVFAVPVLRLSFRYEISWLNMEYRPWRLLIQISSLPGIIGIVYLSFLHESPKFLLSIGKNEESLLVLKNIFHCNTGHGKENYSVIRVYLDDEIVVIPTKTSFLRKMWNQTAPLFKPPLLRNSIILYYLLLCAYMTTTGFTMWVPTVTNAFFNGEDNSGRSFCDVASHSPNTHKMHPGDCDHVIKTSTLYAMMCFAVAACTISILLSFIVTPLGKKFTTLMVFAISALCGILLLFMRNPLLNLIFFVLFIFVCVILGNVNTYLVELNPTHLRGMATCLSVVVSRGFSFISVQLIASLLEDHCTLMISGYVALVISGFFVATLLPPDSKLNKGQA